MLADHEEELGGAFSRKTLTAIIAVLVVVGSLGVVLVWYTVDEGQVLGVDILPPSRSEDVLTFAYTVRTERALASGAATFTALVNGTAEHTRNVQVDGGGGRVDLRFSAFVVGNGDYTFNLDYKGTRGTTHYLIGTPDRTNFIVTAMSVTARNETWVDDGRRGAVELSTYFYSDIALGIQTKAPPNSSLTLQLKKNTVTDGAPIVLVVEGRTFVTRILNVSLGPGNYTVEAMFTNQWVKDDAAIKVLSGDGTAFVHNKPRACLVLPPSGVYHGNNANNYTITADASCSTDDVAIVQYTWDFGDGTAPVTNGATPTEVHQYPGSTGTRSYTGSVTAYDNFGQWDTAFFTVTTSFS